MVTFPEVAFWQPDTYAVTFATHLGADQRFWNDTASAQLAVYAFRPRGGPDSLGYVWFDSDDPLGPEYDWQELYAQGTLLGWGDDSLWQLDLPWTFRLYGRDCTMAWVSTNGWLAVGPPSQTNPADSNAAIPSEPQPNRLIAPFWDDLWVKGGEGGIWYQTFGDSVLVIEWHHVRRKGCDRCSLNFETKLFRSGAIEFHYAGVTTGDPQYDAGASASVGIENYTGTVGLQYLCNGEPPGNLLESGRAIRFAYILPGLAEGATQPAVSPRSEPTVVRGVLVLPNSTSPSSSTSCLLDIAGRKVMALASGSNDVRRLAPGVYVICSQDATTKVLLLPAR